jgi:quercetin dioxygenase-like cupin family protein
MNEERKGLCFNQMFVKGDQTNQVEMVPGALRRTLGHGEEMLLAEFTLAAGAEVLMHSHPHAQVGYMVRGRMQLTVSEETYTVETGDSYYILGDVPHAAVSLENSVVVDIFCPPRQDYLEE